MFDLCAHDLSKLFWSRLLHMNGWGMSLKMDWVEARGNELNASIANMDYKTGSVPLSTAAWLFMLAFYLRPQRTVEVGTFLGKSTMALALGQNGGEIWTCDKDNNVPGTPEQWSELNTKVHFHPKTTSTAMLNDKELKWPVGLLFFDGRILPDDIDPILTLSNDSTVYAFDDFEGTEKGVANVAALRTKDHVLIYPPAPELLYPHGVTDRSTLALLVPVKMFRFTAQ